jgi:hypothetical protein
MIQVAACVLHLQPWVLPQVPVPEMLSCGGSCPSHYTGHITGTAATALIDSPSSPCTGNAQLWRDPSFSSFRTLHRYSSCCTHISSPSSPCTVNAQLWRDLSFSLYRTHHRYSSYCTHRFSLKSLYHKCSAVEGPVLLIIQDTSQVQQLRNKVKRMFSLSFFTKLSFKT